MYLVSFWNKYYMGIVNVNEHEFPVRTLFCRHKLFYVFSGFKIEVDIHSYEIMKVYTCHRV